MRSLERPGGWGYETTSRTVGHRPLIRCKKMGLLFRPKEEEDTIDWMKLRIGELHNVYYIKNQLAATLAVLFITHCIFYSTCFGRFLRPLSGVLKAVIAATGAVATYLGHPYWIYIIPTHGRHQWLLLQFLVLLMMDTESVRNM